MVRIFFNLLLRNFLKEKYLNLLNILGLSFGLIAFALVMLYYNHEASYDRFHSDYENTYRLEGKTNTEFWQSNLDYTYGRQFKAETYPAIKTLVEITPFGNIFFSYEDKQFVEQKIYRVLPGSRFFDVFDLEMIEGNKEGVLKDAYATVMTEQTAKRYFGDESALGKVINYDTLLLKVTGVVANLPSNSHLDFDIIYANPRSADQHFHAFMYLQLTAGSDPRLMEEQILGMNEDLDEFHKLTTVKLMPIEDIHFRSEAVFGAGGKGDWPQLMAFLITGFLILLIAITNYINLSMAIYSSRRLEIGMRKVLGESRRRVVYMLCLESIMITLVCIPLALVGISLLLPAFSNFLGLSIENQFFLSAPYLLIGVAVVVVVSLITVSYPVAILSRSKISKLVKSKTSSKEGYKFRNALVLLQFVLLFTLGISAGLVNQQINFIDNKDVGYSTPGVIKIQNAFALGVENYKVFKQKLMNYSEIQNVTHGAMVGDAMAPLAYSPEGHDAIYENLLSYGIGEDYFDLMNIQITDGDFRQVMEEAESGQVVSLVNQSFVNEYEWQGQAVGKTIKLRPGTENELSRTVSAVFKDIHFFSLKEKIVPQIMSMRKDPTNVNLNVLVKTNPANLKRAYEIIEKEWYELVPGRPVNLRLLDDEISDFYAKERRIAQVSLIFSVLAVLLSVGGLVVFIVYVTKLKAKEIAVRKVLGASVAQIILLLNKQTSIIILVSAVLGSTISYFLIDEWLSNFAYTITLNPLVFLLAAFIVYVVVFLITGSQSLQSASANPVEALKQE